MTNRLLMVCMSFLVFSLFSGCIKEDSSLCDSKVPFQIRAIWPDSLKKPEGIRVAIYPLVSGSHVADNFPPEGGGMSISTGSYAFLIHNNDNVIIRLRNIKRYETYEAFTKEIAVPTYKPPVADEAMVEQPDALWVASVDRYEIAQSQVLNVYPQPIVHTYIFTLKNVKGIENIKAIRGSISGMMGTCFLNSTIVSTKPYTIFFENGTIESGIKFVITAFGVLDHTLENGAVKKRSHILTVEFMNKSEVRRYNIDVTDRLNRIPLGGRIDIYSEIEVLPGEDINDGGFNADVGGWDNVIVPLG